MSAVANPPLSKIIGSVQRGLAEADAAIGPFDASAPGDWYQRRRDAMKQIADRLTEEFGAKVSDRWDGASIRLAGIRSTSTGGMGGAIRNWLTAARKKAASA